MRNEIWEKIYKDCPTVFPKNKYGYSIGFECDTGWFQIIYDLSKKIQDWNVSQPENSHCVALQIKEKFGTLRYYTNFHPAELNDAFIEAEKRSYTTCEACGASEAKEDDTQGWIKTLCDKCLDERSGKNVPEEKSN